MWIDRGRAPRTIDAYARGLAEYLLVCERGGIDPVAANRSHVAAFVKELARRPSHRGSNVVRLDSGVGLSNATLQQRLVSVRLFYDYLIEEGLREANPVGRGRYTPGRSFGSYQRSLVLRVAKLPWIPSEQQWLELLAVVREEPIRNCVMLALAYDAALRREELRSLRTDDLDPAHRRLRIRAETTKTRRDRVVPYSAATGVLMSDNLKHRATISKARGPQFLSESRRNCGQPVDMATRSICAALLPGAPRQWMPRCCWPECWFRNRCAQDGRSRWRCPIRRCHTGGCWPSMSVSRRQRPNQ